MHTGETSFYDILRTKLQTLKVDSTIPESPQTE